MIFLLHAGSPNSLYVWKQETDSENKPGKGGRHGDTEVKLSKVCDTRSSALYAPADNLIILDTENVTDQAVGRHDDTF